MSWCPTDPHHVRDPAKSLQGGWILYLSKSDMLHHSFILYRRIITLGRGQYRLHRSSLRFVPYYSSCLSFSTPLVCYDVGYVNESTKSNINFAAVLALIPY